MSAAKRTAGIVDAIRSGTTQALSSAHNFIATLPILDAAMLAAVIGALVGWRFE